MMASTKTNAVRLLESLAIPFELREYEVDPDDLSAETVAAKIDFPLDQTFKTLVARGDHTGVMFAVVPGGAALDLKALAKASGDRKTDPSRSRKSNPSPVTSVEASPPLVRKSHTRSSSTSSPNSTTPSPSPPAAAASRSSCPPATMSAPWAPSTHPSPRTKIRNRSTGWAGLEPDFHNSQVTPYSKGRERRERVPIRLLDSGCVSAFPTPTSPSSAPIETAPALQYDSYIHATPQ